MDLLYSKENLMSEDTKCPNKELDQQGPGKALDLSHLRMSSLMQDWEIWIDVENLEMDDEGFLASYERIWTLQRSKSHLTQNPYCSSSPFPP